MADRLKKKVAAVISIVNEAYQAIRDLPTAWRIETSEAAQQDDIGMIAGEPRNGLDTAGYRNAIRDRLQINNGEATTDEIIFAAQVAVNGAVEYCPRYPAAFEILSKTSPITGDLTKSAIDNIAPYVGAGIDFRLREGCGRVFLTWRTEPGGFLPRPGKPLSDKFDAPPKGGQFSEIFTRG